MTNPVLTAWNRLQEPCDDYLRHRWVEHAANINPFFPEQLSPCETPAAGTCPALPCLGALPRHTHLECSISDKAIFESFLCFSVALQFRAVLFYFLFYFFKFYFVWFFLLFFFLRIWRLSYDRYTHISYFLCQHVPIKFRSLFVLLWLIFKGIENDAEVIAGKIDLTVLHKCQQCQGNAFREVTIRALTRKARCAHSLYPLNRLTPAQGISKTMQKMRCYIKHDSGPDCSGTSQMCREDPGWKSLGSWRGLGPWCLPLEK